MLRLAVHQRVERAIDHANVIVTGELLLHIDQIFVYRIQAPRKQLAEMHARLRTLLEESARFGYGVESARAQGAHGRRVRLIEQRRKIAEHRARLSRRRDHHSSLHDLDLTFDKDKENPGRGAFFKYDFAGRESTKWIIAERFENHGHDGAIPSGCDNAA